jgi:hypothetical protein
VENDIQLAPQKKVGHPCNSKLFSQENKDKKMSPSWHLSVKQNKVMFNYFFVCVKTRKQYTVGAKKRVGHPCNSELFGQENKDIKMSPSWHLSIKQNKVMFNYFFVCKEWKTIYSGRQKKVDHPCNSQLLGLDF